MVELDISKLPPPFGLNNSGVTCYFNSLLQALVTCTSFIETLRNMENKNNLVRDILQISTSDNILSHLRNRFKKFGNSQESASEGLILLLELIDDPEIYKLFSHVYEERIVCMKCRKINSNNRDSAIHFEIFDEEKLLQDGLQKYLLEYYNKISDYDGICKFCGHTKFTRWYRLKYIPEIVICLLNRYTTRRSVTLPETFEISGISSPIKYKKISEINHSGNLNGGHYVCVAVRNDGNVYEFNDSSVSPSSLGTKLSTYLTFYHRVQ